MRDINFFSTYRTARARSTDTIVIATVVAVVVIGVAVFGYLAVTNSFDQKQKEIDTIKAYINSTEVTSKLDAYKKMQLEYALLQRYETAVEGAAKDISTKSAVKVETYLFVESIIPQTTKVTALSIQGPSMSISCLSTVGTDAMDILHALNMSNRFSKVTITGLAMSSDGTTTFSFVCTEKEATVS